MGAQVRLQTLAVLAARLRATEAGQPQPYPAHAHLAKQRREQDDRLGVDGGVVGAERLGTDLPELAIAPRLGALMAEEAR